MNCAHPPDPVLENLCKEYEDAVCDLHDAEKAYGDKYENAVISVVVGTRKFWERTGENPDWKAMPEVIRHFKSFTAMIHKWTEVQDKEFGIPAKFDRVNAACDRLNAYTKEKGITRDGKY